MREEVRGGHFTMRHYEIRHVCCVPGAHCWEMHAAEAAGKLLHGLSLEE